MHEESLTFKEGSMYKHRRMIDMVIKVLGVSPREDSVELYVNWYNPNFNGFVGEDTINVKKSDLASWNIFTS